MQYEIKSTHKKKRLLAEIVVPELIKELNLTGSKKKLMVLIRPSGLGFKAATAEFASDNVIVIAMNSKIPMHEAERAFAHEMVHVKQYAKGQLKVNDKTGYSYWLGKKISKKVDYLDQPWEREAFARQELLRYKVGGYQ